MNPACLSQGQSTAITFSGAPADHRPPDESGALVDVSGAMRGVREKLQQLCHPSLNHDKRGLQVDKVNKIFPRTERK
jgi:hypothetical protein